MKNKQNITLIIDDEMDVSAMLEKRLRWAGYDVVRYHQGKGALDVIRSLLPQLILLDIKLPDISGYDLYQSLKQDSALKKIPVIFLSALHEEEGHCLRDLGAQGFIKKPFDSQQVLDLIEKILKHREASEQTDSPVR